MARLSDSVRTLSGVGDKRAQQLHKLGIDTLGDFLSDYPRDYEDRSKLCPIDQAREGDKVCVCATVGTPPVTCQVRGNVTLTKLKVFDETGTMGLVFFHRPYVKNQLVLGGEYCFFGKVELFGKQKTMTNPEFEPAGQAGSLTGRIVPVYRKTEGITRNMLLSGVRAALACLALEQPPAVIPPELEGRYQLMPAVQALRAIHLPKDMEEVRQARRRLIFEELFVFACASARLKGMTAEQPGDQLEWHDPEELYALLPYSPTDAQKKAISQAFADMCSGKRMNRLVQGDVGSGKTLVAAACAWLAVKNGRQAAIMAPTEILAHQHVQSLSPLFEACGMRVGLLTASLSKRQKNWVKDAALVGAVDVLCGTHALLTGDVAFARPALFVVDEQHRFGVRQRAALTEKGECAHTLVMSATPIPRTLTLIIYGDLDVSILDELPPGRQPIETVSVGEDKRQRMWGFVKKQVDLGGQAYIVCPLVEEQAEEEYSGNGRRAATQYAQHLQQDVFPDLRVGLLHGKMRPLEKDQVMARFAAGEIDVLVATTVIEVGVNVPNATLMVVENAELFGLSQLHQLRGRVGRGARQSYCVLMRSDSSQASRARLAAICKTSDGFAIAEEDLKLRGPGDFFGQRQHGLPEFRLADLNTDLRVLQEAQSAARELLANDPELARPDHQDLRRRMEDMLLSAQNGALN